MASSERKQRDREEGKLLDSGPNVELIGQRLRGRIMTLEPRCTAMVENHKGQRLFL